MIQIPTVPKVQPRRRALARLTGRRDHSHRNGACPTQTRREPDHPALEQEQIQIQIQNGNSTTLLKNRRVVARAHVASTAGQRGRGNGASVATGRTTSSKKCSALRGQNRSKNVSQNPGNRRRARPDIAAVSRSGPRRGRCCAGSSSTAARTRATATCRCRQMSIRTGAA